MTAEALRAATIPLHENWPYLPNADGGGAIGIVRRWSERPVVRKNRKLPEGQTEHRLYLDLELQAGTDRDTMAAIDQFRQRTGRLPVIYLSARFLKSGGAILPPHRSSKLYTLAQTVRGDRSSGALAFEAFLGWTFHVKLKDSTRDWDGDPKPEAAWITTAEKVVKAVAPSSHFSPSASSLQPIARSQEPVANSQPSDPIGIGEEKATGERVLVAGAASGRQGQASSQRTARPEDAVSEPSGLADADAAEASVQRLQPGSQGPRPCGVCGRTQFWKSFYGKLTCARCHAPALEELVAEWVEAAPWP